MMDEMQKTLARRRAKVDRSSEEPDSDRQDGDSGRRQELEKSCSPGKPFSQPASQAGSESPRPGKERSSQTIVSDTTVIERSSISQTNMWECEVISLQFLVKHTRLMHPFTEH